jgi:hypothetical protein
MLIAWCEKDSHGVPIADLGMKYFHTNTRYIYFWNPHKKHYKSALEIVQRSAFPAKRWTRVGAALISQLANIERERDEVLMRESMVTPVCAHVGFDSMRCGCQSACCKRISIVTGHLWTGLRNSASSLQITARLDATHYI